MIAGWYGVGYWGRMRVDVRIEIMVGGRFASIREG